MSNDVTEINLKMMRTFVTLIECDGNASTAAKRLGISQPLMSQRLATLQHNHPTMRFAWLQKDGKTWSTTMAGRRVLPAIEEIVRLSRLVQEDTNLSIDRSPPVTIACGQLAATTFVRSAMMAFRKRHPGVLVRICTPRGAQRVEGVETGIFDL
ncbi:MAG: LysR family transcriptional regulator, partial [Planctomycetota bacterium]